MTFPKYGGDYFCFIDGNRFKNKTKLMMHLQLHPYRELHAWGIQKNRLVRQCSELSYQYDEKKKYNVTYRKRVTKERVKEQAIVRQQALDHCKNEVDAAIAGNQV
jgi:hypothetical protein